MADVHAIGPGIVSPREPNADVIERLKNLLAMAEAGEIKAIAYLAWRDDDALLQSWSSGTTNRELVQGASRLWWNVMKNDDDIAKEC